MRKNHIKKVEEGKKAVEILAEDLSAEEKRKAEFHLILEAIKADRKACVDLKCMNTTVAEVNNEEVAQSVNGVARSVNGVTKKRNS